MMIGISISIVSMPSAPAPTAEVDVIDDLNSAGAGADATVLDDLNSAGQGADATITDP